MIEPDLLVAQIVKAYMGLSDRNIWLRSQDIKAPTGEDDLWAVVGVRLPRTLGTKSFLDTDTNEDVQQVAMATTIDIDLASKSTDATTRAWEVTAALESIPAIQLMEKNNMSVYRTMDAVNLDAVEGAGTLHRTRISVIVYYMVEKRKSTIQIFEEFPTEVN